MCNISPGLRVASVTQGNENFESIICWGLLEYPSSVPLRLLGFCVFMAPAEVTKLPGCALQCPDENVAMEKKCALTG